MMWPGFQGMLFGATIALVSVVWLANSAPWRRTCRPIPPPPG